LPYGTSADSFGLRPAAPSAAMAALMSRPMMLGCADPDELEAPLELERGARYRSRPMPVAVSAPEARPQGAPPAFGDGMSQPAVMMPPARRRSPRARLLLLMMLLAVIAALAWWLV